MENYGLIRHPIFNNIQKSEQNFYSNLLQNYTYTGSLQESSQQVFNLKKNYKMPR